MVFLFLIPFFLVRFGLMAALGRGAVARAAHFAPLVESEKTANRVYQISTVVILLYPVFLRVRTAPSALFYAGIGAYALGMVLLIASVVSFSSPSENGINQSGLYRISRNPMYVAYFFVFLGCALLAQSPVLLVTLLCLQVSTHWIIRAEERWCIQQFGDAYLQYMKRVRRYI